MTAFASFFKLLHPPSKDVYESLVRRGQAICLSGNQRVTLQVSADLLASPSKWQLNDGFSEEQTWFPVVYLTIIVAPSKYNSLTYEDISSRPSEQVQSRSLDQIGFRSKTSDLLVLPTSSNKQWKMTGRVLLFQKLRSSYKRTKQAILTWQRAYLNVSFLSRARPRR